MMNIWQPLDYIMNHITIHYSKPKTKNYTEIELIYTFLRLGGRHPLCGSGVTSTISVTSIPAA